MMHLRQPLVIPKGRPLRVLVHARFSTEEQRQSSIDDQIAAIERQLEQQRELLTSSFIAMETAQSSYNNMQTQLTKSFFSDTSK